MSWQQRTKYAAMTDSISCMVATPSYSLSDTASCGLEIEVLTNDSVQQYRPGALPLFLDYFVLYVQSSRNHSDD
jgi:hypothetical protein